MQERNAADVARPSLTLLPAQTSPARPSLLRHVALLAEPRKAPVIAVAMAAAQAIVHGAGVAMDAPRVLSLAIAFQLPALVLAAMLAARVADDWGSGFLRLCGAEAVGGTRLLAGYLARAVAPLAALLALDVPVALGLLGPAALPIVLGAALGSALLLGIGVVAAVGTRSSALAVGACAAAALAIGYSAYVGLTDPPSSAGPQRLLHGFLGPTLLEAVGFSPDPWRHGALTLMTVQALAMVAVVAMAIRPLSTPRAPHGGVRGAMLILGAAALLVPPFLLPWEA